MEKGLGNWSEDQNGLPKFDYTGVLPFQAADREGKPVKLPEDPWFLIGNYQLTLFTHVSGEYELIAGQRSWGRINAGEKANSGQNRAAIWIDERGHELCGMASVSAHPEMCSREFGCGYAKYGYQLEGIKVTRILAAQPSLTVSGGKSAFLIRVELTNTDTENHHVRYEEGITAHYVEIQCQHIPEKNRKIHYCYRSEQEKNENCGYVYIEGSAEDPLLCATPDTESLYDGFPPYLYMAGLSENVKTRAAGRDIIAHGECELSPGESIRFSVLVGYQYLYENESVAETVKELQEGAEEEIPYAEQWKKVLPEFGAKKDASLSREMRWHAYVLEAMATYSHYYRETKIPQGTVYDYDWGQHASARDNFQHALPLVYYNQPLARSILRYMMKRTTAFGEIRLIEYGNGHADNGSYYTSDQQLFFFLLLSEYLRVTGDYTFLSEKVPFYPGKGSGEAAVLDFVEKCYLFLRDIVNVGNHGLVRLCNSDWNDTLYYIIKAPYNRVYFSGESHMNSAMAVSILQELIPQLQRAVSHIGREEQIQRLCRSMSLYRERIRDAFFKDMEGRAFPRRMYFDGVSYGEDNMFLEPMGYTLQIDELSDDRKRALYAEMQRRVYDGEKLGARQQQTPEFEDEAYDKGSRENGGFWWALNGPVIIGVNTFDREEAQRLLRQMSFEHYRETFPQYWSSYWSAADNIESSLIPEEGLPDQSENYSGQPVFCAHPHAWLLYCYFRINSQS